MSLQYAFTDPSGAAITFRTKNGYLPQTPSSRKANFSMNGKIYKWGTKFNQEPISQAGIHGFAFGQYTSDPLFKAYQLHPYINDPLRNLGLLNTEGSNPNPIAGSNGITNSLISPGGAPMVWSALDDTDLYVRFRDNPYRAGDPLSPHYALAMADRQAGDTFLGRERMKVAPTDRVGLQRNNRRVKFHSSVNLFRNGDHVNRNTNIHEDIRTATDADRTQSVKYAGLNDDLVSFEVDTNPADINLPDHNNEFTEYHYPNLTANQTSSYTSDGISISGPSAGVMGASNDINFNEPPNTIPFDTSLESINQYPEDEGYLALHSYISKYVHLRNQYREKAPSAGNFYLDSSYNWNGEPQPYQIENDRETISIRNSNIIKPTQAKRRYAMELTTMLAKIKHGEPVSKDQFDAYNEHHNDSIKHTFSAMDENGNMSDNQQDAARFAYRYGTLVDELYQVIGSNIDTHALDPSSNTNDIPTAYRVLAAVGADADQIHSQLTSQFDLLSAMLGRQPINQGSGNLIRSQNSTAFASPATYGSQTGVNDSITYSQVSSDDSIMTSTLDVGDARKITPFKNINTRMNQRQAQQARQLAETRSQILNLRRTPGLGPAQRIPILSNQIEDAESEATEAQRRTSELDRVRNYTASIGTRAPATRMPPPRGRSMR